MSTVDWPSSPLDAAQRAFTLLAQPPTHVGFDGRGLDGLPDEILPLDELRDLLLSPAASVEVRDTVWRELVTRARPDGPAWAVAAAVIDADEANLIAATRLDNATVAQAADRLGIPASTASDWRARAERRLAQAIAVGELAFVPLRPRQARHRPANTPDTGPVG